MSVDIHLTLETRLNWNRGSTDMKKTLEVAAIILTSLFFLALAVVSLLGMIDPQKASVG
jgi:hypothetical protein